MALRRGRDPARRRWRRAGERPGRRSAGARASALALLIVLGIGVVAAAEVRNPTPLAPGADRDSQRAIAIRGEITDLYPGATAPLTVRVRNRSDAAVSLRSLRGRVKPAAHGCGHRFLDLGRLRARRLLEPGERTELELDVAMSAGAPDACQGARWPLRFHARGHSREDR